MKRKGFVDCGAQLLLILYYVVMQMLNELYFVCSQLFERYDITAANLHSNQHKTSTKRSVIETAQHWLLYFARIFPVSVSDEL